MRNAIDASGWAFRSLIIVISVTLISNADRMTGLGFRQDEVKHALRRKIETSPGSVVWRDLFRGEWDQVCIVGAYGNRVNDNDGLWTIVFIKGRKVYARLDSSVDFIDIQYRAWSRGCYAPHDRAILVGSVAPFGRPTLIENPRTVSSPD